MTAQYPIDIPVYTNPTASMTLGSADHVALHSNVNDDVVQLATRLGKGATMPDANYKSLAATGSGNTAWGYTRSVLLGTYVHPGGSNVMEISSIPQVFRHIEIVIFGRSDAVAAAATGRLTFESTPTTGAMSYSLFNAAGSSLSGSDSGTGGDFCPLMVVPAASSSPSNAYGMARLLIAEYASTTFWKPFVATGAELSLVAAGGFTTKLVGGFFRLNTAIDRVRLTLSNGNWTTISRMSLYGIP